MQKLSAFGVLMCSLLVTSTTAKLVTFPPPMSFAGPKLIPDEAHPYIAPSSDDKRGPCPGLNTLANHGYLPRNGIASVSDIINAAQEGFNLDYHASMGFASYALLTRGNVLEDLVSIGGESSQIPPLPGNIDGIPGGLSKHGRFEGDVSMTRRDAALGSDSKFDPGMYANLLSFVDKYGSGNNVTVEVFAQYRQAIFENDLRTDPNLTFHVGRNGFGYGEAGFVLGLFPSSKFGNLTVDVMSSFFEHERFPPNWFRSAAPFTFVDIVLGATAVSQDFDAPPGAKNASGVYVFDVDDIPFPCDIEANLVGQNVPGVLLSTTGTLQKNVQTLLGGVHQLFAPYGCPVVTPAGPAFD